VIEVLVEADFPKRRRNVDAVMPGPLVTGGGAPVI
jgi:hypothetical protein